MMQKQVIFRDRQELQNTDLDNVQIFTNETLKALIAEAVTNDIVYAGLEVTQDSATEITVAAGHLYNNGQIYVNEQAVTLNLSTLLPLTAKRMVTITCWGSDVETDVQPRDFLIDLATGTTEPQSVAMEALRKANIDKASGSESTDPQPAVLSAGVIAVAYVTLTTTGIESVVMNTTTALPSLKDQNQRVTTLEAWQGKAQPRIDSIATDLSALAEKTTDLTERDNFVDLALDVAALREQLNLPAAYAESHADDFNDNTKTDEAGTGYDAVIDAGIVFAADAESSINLALSNPVDPSLYIGADNVVLPKFNNVLKINTGTNLASSLSISQYQSQSHTLKKYTKTTRRVQYGWRWTRYKPWYLKLMPRKSRGYLIRQKYRYVSRKTSTYYKPEVTTTSITGSLLAQTFLVANAMWLTKVGAYLTQVGNTGDLNVKICETVNGKPDLQQIVSETTVAQADLKTYPDETEITINPALLQAGKRYAVVYITQGDHYAATVDGNNYTQGTIFSGTDGDYLQGDLTKDLMFKLYAAEFTTPRTEIDLGALSLAGGLSDIDLEAETIEPEGTELHYEIRVAGVWYRLDDEIDHLTSLPDLVQLRAVFLGTSDLQPLLTLTDNAIKVSRAKEALTHWSENHVLAANSEDITVDLVVANYNSTNHGITITLENGSSYSADTVDEIIEDDEATRIRARFLPVPGTGIGNYQIKVVGTRNTGTEPFSIVQRADVAV
jgi:hypothetical protein